MRFFATALLLLAPAVAHAQPRRACTDEPELQRVAAHFVGRGSVDARALAETARAEGSDLPSLHALVGRDDVRLDAELAALAQRSDAPLVCGEARDGDLRVLVVGERGGRLAVDGDVARVRLASGFSDGRIVLLDSRGETRDVALDEGSAELPLAGVTLPVTIQLVATGTLGPRPVSVVTLGDPHAPGRPSARDPLALVAALRQELALPAVRENELLAHAARAHAQDVCDAGRVAHRLPGGDDPVERLAAVSVRARVVGETVARGETLPRALDELARSPSHRETLIDRRFTDAGSGSATDARGRTCVVVLLAAWPRFVPP